VTRAYRTLTRPERVESDKIKGSRFIASGFPFTGEEHLATEIQRLREEFKNANHHCYAWREGQRFRYNDDGEPSGSAGKPILQQIDGRGLDRVAIVITRVFGGTKLGVGGLIRAYGGAAGAMLDKARTVERIPFHAVCVTIPYSLSAALAGVVAAFDLEPVDSTFGEQVRQTFHVATDRTEAFVAAVAEQTAGRAGTEITDPDARG
jgi:uncharacterized YigZ family protein